MPNITDTFVARVGATPQPGTPGVLATLTVISQYEDRTYTPDANWAVAFQYTIGFPKCTAPFQLSWSEETDGVVTGSDAPSHSFVVTAPQISYLPEGKTNESDRIYRLADEIQNNTVQGNVPGTPNKVYTGTITMVQPSA